MLFGPGSRECPDCADVQGWPQCTMNCSPRYDVVRPPRRVQMHRRAGGWRQEHADAIIVDRRTVWGNPFVIGHPGVPDAATAVELFRSAIILAEFGRRRGMANATILEALPGPVPTLEAIRQVLRGRDLACWCALDQPCHADVLLDLANAPEPAVEADVGERCPCCQGWDCDPVMGCRHDDH